MKIYFFIINLLLCLLGGMLSQSFFNLFAQFIFLVLGIFFCGKEVKNNKAIDIFLTLFAFYSLFTITTHFIFINNPYEDYFLSIDQQTFYKYSEELGQENWGEIFSEAFTQFKYSELPLAVSLMGILHKIALYFHCIDILYFLKLHIVLLTALISVFIYKITMTLGGLRKNTCQLIILFGLFSPLLLFSCQLLRDMHICFLYVLMLYVVVKEQIKFRYISLLLLAFTIFLFRMENGLFAMLFIALRVSIDYRKNNSYVKFIILFCIIISIIFSAIYIYTIMIDTLTSYSARALAEADYSSLGAKMAGFPFPLNYILCAVFSQILPFPLWISYNKIDNYQWIMAVESITPLFWMSVWSIIIYAFIKKRKQISFFLKYVLCIALIYILLVAGGEINTRRLMAVYPLVFIVFLEVKDKVSIMNKKFVVLSICSLFLLLHIVYIFIK